MESNFIVEVNESDFEYEVIAYSNNTPVVVDFWAEWCGPCRMIGPVLEKIAREENGSFRLAKLNVDHNQSLAVRYGVNGIPAVKAFKRGKVIAEFVGVRPEPQIREFIRKIAPSEDDLILSKGINLLESEEIDNAEMIFRDVLSKSPNNPVALLGLAKSLLWKGNGTDAFELLTNFPASQEFSTAQMLLPMAEALKIIENESDDQSLMFSDEPLEAAFRNSLRLIKKGNFEAAMDGMLDILREDKHYRNDLVRKSFIGILTLMGDDNPISRRYRNELASVLF